MMSIQDIVKAVKQHEHALFTIFLVTLIGLLGYSLGRLSAIDDARVPVTIENAVVSDIQDVSQNADVEGLNLPQGGLLVGSKNSDKFHFPWCSGAQRISEKNKIWFSSKEEAERAGYIPAGNCPGL